MGVKVRFFAEPEGAGEEGPRRGHPEVRPDPDPHDHDKEEQGDGGAAEPG